jgi:hypothetical protein
MKTKEVKVSELSGSALDWAVAKCEGEELRLIKGQPETLWTENGWKPSTDWSQGGPIIELNLISVGEGNWFPSSKFMACLFSGDVVTFGKTYLEAAMRCYVASKLGDTVSVPVELLEV